MTKNTIYIKRLYKGSRGQAALKGGDLLEKQGEYLALVARIYGARKPAPLLDFCHAGPGAIQIFGAFSSAPLTPGHLPSLPARFFPAGLPENQQPGHPLESAA